MQAHDGKEGYIYHGFGMRISTLKAWNPVLFVYRWSSLKPLGASMKKYGSVILVQWLQVWAFAPMWLYIILTALYCAQAMIDR